MAIPLPKVDFESFDIGCVDCHREPFRLANRIPIVDNGEPLVDLRETNPELSFADYCLPYVRVSVADSLKVASVHVPDHLELRIFTALRTLEQQAEMYWGNYNRKREEHPEWHSSTLRRVTNRFFAPPDAKAPPGHCTGAAVDVGLFNRETGEGLDMSSPLKGWKGAPTAAKGLSPEAAANRRLLCFVMHSTGLSNCRDEYWHWSYGDSPWAVRVGAKTACYGLIEPPEGASRVNGGRIVVHPYDPEWLTQFETIKESLLEVVGDLAVAIEHVGSTAVPGLGAKPILDIAIVVPNQEAMSAAISSLTAFGYEHQGDLGIAGREAFRCKGDKEKPPKNWPKHHLYACVEGARELRRYLAFRDHLRANRVAVEAYEALKCELAKRYPWDRARYSTAKSPFVTELLREIDPGLLG